MPELRTVAWMGVESLTALGVSLALALALGGPLGVLLYQLARVPPTALARTLHGLCALPCVILLPALAPLLGGWLECAALATALGLAAVPLCARLVASSLRQVPRGLIDACQAMGASPLQIVIQAMLPEARAALAQAAGLLAVCLLACQIVAQLALEA